MRQALSVQNGNRRNKDSVVDFKNAGKLTRQVGRTNLRSEADINDPPAYNVEVKSDFEVYEDPSPAKENVENDNNMIHELEKKLEKKTHENELKNDMKNFMQARDCSNDRFSVYDDASSAAPSICGTVNFDDDDFDRLSAISSNTTTSIRAGFSHFHVEKREVVENPFEDSDAQRKYALKKAEIEKRNDDMLMCEEYYNDIFKYMFRRQSIVRASSRYMKKQVEVSIEMRAILIDWFNDVTTEYGLQQETLHLAVALVDRVLSKFCVEKHRLQLVGTTSLMIAAKYEEIYPPELSEFAQITDNTFKPDQILMMERYLLSQLDYTVSTPTVAWFANSFAKRQGANKRTRDIMMYLIDLSLLDFEFLKFLPSHIAAASLCFANVMNEQDPWPKKLEEEFGITLSGFSVILPFLHKGFKDAPNGEYPSFYTKYSDSCFGKIATLSPPEERYVVETDALRNVCPKLFEKSTPI